MPLGRRELIIGSTGWLAGCASSAFTDYRYNFITPSKMATSLSTGISGTYGFIFTQYLTAVKLYYPELLNKQAPEASADPPTAAKLARLREIMASPWEIRIGAHDIALGRKHLFATVGSTATNFPFLRIDGLATKPQPFGTEIDFQIQTYSLRSDNILMGVFSNPELPPVVGEDDKRITVYRGDYRQMLGFIDNAAHYVMAHNLQIRPYGLLGPNSNAFVANLLENCIDGFDKAYAAQQISAAGWSAPGFSNDLLKPSGFKRVSADQMPARALDFYKQHASGGLQDTLASQANSLSLILMGPVWTMEIYIDNFDAYLSGAFTPKVRGSSAKRPIHAKVLPTVAP